MPMTLVNSETLASLYYTLAENELSPQESTEILQKFWRLSDSEYPKLNSTLVEEVANLLHQRYAQQREDFLDYFYFDGLGGLSFRYLAAYLCWDFPVSKDILEHSLKDLSPPAEQRVTIFWGTLDLARIIAALVGLGKGGTRRGQMQLVALRNLVFETVDSHHTEDVKKTLTVFCILVVLLALVIVPILGLSMLGWSFLTLDWQLLKLRSKFSKFRSLMPQISLRWWVWMLISILCFGFICMGLIVVEPYKTDLYDHAYRVLRLYLTLAIARVAPILTRIASYWEAYRNLLEFAKGRRDERFPQARRPYKQLAFYISWFIFAAFVVQPRVNFWARTMKARIPILEAQVHWELWKLGRLPNAVAWADLEAFAA
eukprot:symbB.v1.2.034382.t2/scaffold4427.1/size39785/5